MNLNIKRIVCLTEESVEFLFAIGRSDLIVGVSVYALRPKEVKSIPVVSTFTHSNLKKIKNLNPDLVIGFSDIQKDIAKDLIDMGLNVFISNQRSIHEILSYLWQLGHMIGEADKTVAYINLLKSKLEEGRAFGESLKIHPRVYIEEWDEPQITGIRWFSELVEICGGVNIFSDKSNTGIKAQERFVSDEEVAQKKPDMILACWCGKKVEIESFFKRLPLSKTPAVMNKQIIELAPEIFLQPGPALIVDGIDQLMSIFKSYESNHLILGN